jgi:hypothetical protein
MSRRRESRHAIKRKLLRLAHLKLVDFVRTNDTLVFPYKDTTYSAWITTEGYIATARHAAHTLAAFSDTKTSYYQQPSKFTNDCVAAYWRDAGRADGDCLTNPSGYERVRHVPSGKTLNELRDAYMVRYRIGDTDELALDEPQMPSEVAAMRVRSHHKPKQAMPSPPPPPLPPQSSIMAPETLGAELARVLGDPCISIATIQASRHVRGFKDMALALETKVHEHRAMLVALLSHADAQRVAASARAHAGTRTDAPMDDARVDEDDREGRAIRELDLLMSAAI